MKLSLFIAFFAATTTPATAEEGGLRERDLATVGGSVSFPTCFSGESTVQVFGKGAVEMKHLQVGDRIFTGRAYEPVYAFAHFDESSMAEFVQIQLETGNVLEATASHLVFVDDKPAPIRAGSISAGETLEGVPITDVGTVKKTGLYAPLTANGKLLVDGVMASNYVWLEQAEGHALFGHHIHGFSHLAISPFRLICSTISPDVICKSYTVNGIPQVLDSAQRTFDWVMDLPFVLQHVVATLYFAFAATVWFLECVLAAPATFMALAIGVVTITSGLTIRVGGPSSKQA